MQTVPEAFWQKLIIAATGPLVAAIVGTLLAGLFAAWIARKAQERRENHQLRDQLIGQMTEAASALYLKSQEYWRAKRQSEAATKAEAEMEEATKNAKRLRVELDEQYIKSRLAGEILERRLEAFYISDRPRLLWHSTNDLLTVRYFQLIDKANDKLLRANAGPEHSFLSENELKNPKNVTDNYRTRLREATHAVLKEALARPD